MRFNIDKYGTRMLNLEMLKSWNFYCFFKVEILKSWNFEILKSWNLDILKSWNLEILKFWNLENLKFWHLDVWIFSNLAMLQCYNVEWCPGCWLFQFHGHDFKMTILRGRMVIFPGIWNVDIFKCGQVESWKYWKMNLLLGPDYLSYLCYK